MVNSVQKFFHVISLKGHFKLGRISDLNHTNQKKEIERRFLPNIIPFTLTDFPSKEIEQGYLLISNESVERIRKETTLHGACKYFRTLKKGSGVEREESESEISKKEFDLLWTKTENLRVYKTRYEVKYKGLKLEIDVFHEKNNGLIIVEVEFNTRKKSKKFKVPNWFLKEVTNDIRYSNPSLAILGKPS